jgi:TRAP-type C4-dicarboxylate transport system substrate-binding protein
VVKACYGKPINFVLHKNSALGLEKQYFEYMAAGQSGGLRHRLPGPHVDLLEGGSVHRRAVLFRDLAHWNKVLDADLFKPIADEVARRPT